MAADLVAAGLEQVVAVVDGDDGADREVDIHQRGAVEGIIGHGEEAVGVGLALIDLIHFFGGDVADHSGVDQALAHDPVGEHVQGELFFAVEVGGTGDAQVTGADCVDHVFARFSDLAQQVHQITADILVSQVAAEIHLKLRRPGLFAHMRHLLGCFSGSKRTPSNRSISRENQDCDRSDAR